MFAQGALAFLFLLSGGVFNNAAVVDAFHFAMVSGNSAFFEPIEEGWNDVCTELPNVTCEHYHDDWTLLEALDEKYHWTPENRTVHGKPCVAYIRYLIDRGGVDAIATKCNVAEDDPGGTIIQEATDAGIPVVVFAGPHVGPYVSYIGTDNLETGRAMARLLKQLRPEGGTYAVTYNGPSSWQRSIGFVEEIEKDNDRDDKAHWIEEPKLDYERLGWNSWPWKDVTLKGLEGIENYLNVIAEARPTAIGFMYQTPMRSENYTAFVNRNRGNGMSYIGLEGNSDGLRLMSRNFVDGLIGQQTYETGKKAATALYDIVTKGQENVPRMYPTKIINYNLVPDNLPDHDVDQHLLENLKITGLVCFIVVVLCFLLCACWTIYNRSGIVVKASQPFFLVMTAAGVLIMSCTFIPLSMDDAGEDIPESKAIGMCMSIPWLAFSGFAVTFSALFAKTWRVNQFFKSKSAHARIRVSIKDVMAPFFATFSLNTVVLICWTMIDPLTYTRTFSPGTDLYNRDLESVGSCTSENATAFLVPLGLINLALIGTACWQAIEARGITSEFAEAKWIGLTVFSMFQGFLTGIPIVVIVKDDPEAFYLILTFLLFLICMAVLLLIFLPKILIQRKYARMTPAEQRMAMAVSVKRSAEPRGGSSNLSSHHISGLEASGFLKPRRSSSAQERPEQSVPSASGRAEVSSGSEISYTSRLGSSDVILSNGNAAKEEVATSFASGGLVQRLDTGKGRKVESSYISDGEEGDGGMEVSKDQQEK